MPPAEAAAEDALELVRAAAVERPRQRLGIAVLVGSSLGAVAMSMAIGFAASRR